MSIGPEWTEAISTGLQAWPIIKDALKMIPNEEKKQAALKALEEAERASKLLQAKTAVSFEYRICKAHWPPEIMLSKGNLYDHYTEQFECPNCRKIEPGPSSPTLVRGG
jgi:hypothetical protein